MDHFRSACAKGLEDPDARFPTYQFDRPELAREAISELGGSLPLTPFESRECRLECRGERLIAELPYCEGDELSGWSHKGKVWRRGITVTKPLVDLERVDRYVRAVKGETGNGPAILGKFIFADDGRWQRERDSYLIRCILLALGVPKTEIELFIGMAIRHAWKLDPIPFGPEYPGERRWNLGSPQFAISPASQPGRHPHWSMVLKHCFADLDYTLGSDPWGVRTGIRTGAQYGLAWVANLFRHPFDRLPYLFLYGEQNVGKSILHESIAMLMTKGVASADRALTSDFNGELAGAVLAYIEEKDVARCVGAYAKLKDLVTSPTLWVRRMGVDAYQVPNSLHFVQCANDRSACPIEFGDTRIVALHVKQFKQEIPKPLLMSRLREEAPYFLRTILDLPLPEPEGRLRLPPIATASKEAMAADSVSEFARAIADAMQERHSWHGVAKELGELVGPGQWPTDARAIKRELATAESYLRRHHISCEFGSRTNSGRALLITRK